MAKYDINHICGHTEVHGIFGPEFARPGIADWMAARLCSDCYALEKERLRNLKNEKSMITNRDNGLPALIGSERQVNWAETIRATFHADLTDKLQQLRLVNIDDDEFRDRRDELIHWRDQFEIRAQLVMQQNLAVFWIDNRDESVKQIVMSANIGDM